MRASAIGVLLSALIVSPAAAQAPIRDHVEAIRHLRLGQEEMHAEHWDKAEAEFKSAIKLEATLEMAHYGLGQVYMATRRYPAAVAAYLACRDAWTANTTVSARLNLMWGVSPLACEMTPNAEDMVMKAETYLLQKHAVQPGDVIAVVAGTRSSSGSTNFMRLHVVGSGDHAEPARDERRKTARMKAASPAERRKR